MTQEEILKQLRVTLRVSTLGYAETKTPMQKARVQDTLNDIQRFDGVVMSIKELILVYLLKGYDVEKKENHQHYNRNGELTKPKTVYRLYTDENSFYEIKKTAYDFALYVKQNNFLSLDTIKSFVQKETQVNEQAEQERLEAERREQEENERQRELQKQKDKAIREEKIRKWEIRGSQLITPEAKQGLTYIIQNFAKTNNIPLSQEELIQIRDKRFTGFIGNEAYTRSFVKDLLSSRIQLNNQSNALMQDLYFYLFNINIQTSPKKATQILNTFYAGQPIKQAPLNTNATDEQAQQLEIHGLLVYDREPVGLRFKRGTVFYDISLNILRLSSDSIDLTKLRKIPLIDYKDKLVSQEEIDNPNFKVLDLEQDKSLLQRVRLLLNNTL